MHQPRETHWLVAMRVLSYIKSCPGKRLVYRKHSHVRISGYFDSGYVGDPGDRKSTTGYCTFFGENMVTWRSKKKDVSRSSAEAEYRVMVHTACEMVWLKNLLIELSFRQSRPMPMHCDNQSTIYIVQNPVFHDQTH